MVSKLRIIWKQTVGDEEEEEEEEKAAQVEAAAVAAIWAARRRQDASTLREILEVLRLHPESAQVGEHGTWALRLLVRTAPYLFIIIVVVISLVWINVTGMISPS